MERPIVASASVIGQLITSLCGNLGTRVFLFLQCVPPPPIRGSEGAVIATYRPLRHLNGECIDINIKKPGSATRTQMHARALLASQWVTTISLG